MSAILLPFEPGGDIDWAGFDDHVCRTAEVGLVPAVNMDTGYVHLLDDRQREEVLHRTTALLGGQPFVAGALDEAGATLVAEVGGTPVAVPSESALVTTDDDVLVTYERWAKALDRFIGFELSPVFNPAGRIWELDTYRAVLAIPQCTGAKHSSLRRDLEWDRLRVRDELRPDFQGLTGNDLAIDMVMNGMD